MFFGLLSILCIGYEVGAVDNSLCSTIDGTVLVYFPHEDNCSKYYQCSNGKAYLHNCPSDTHFNPVLNVCDHPETAGCIGGNGKENDVGGDNSDNDNGYEGDRNDEQGNGKDGNTTIGTQLCRQSGIECSQGEFSVYGALQDCTQFCQCSNGIPHLHHCPNGTHFNPVSNVCDHPDKAGCVEETVIDNGGGEIEIDNGNGTVDGQENENDDSINPGTQICLQSGIVCPPVDGKRSVYGALPDCTRFCQCSNGLPYLHICANGTHFNPVLNVCDYPDKAGCGGGNEIENGGGDGEIEIENGNGNGGCNNTDGQENENDNSTNPGTQICLQSGIVCPSVDGEHSVYGALPDCTQFCQCSNGLPNLHNCANGTHFNPVLNVCDHPEKAGCTGGNEIENGGGDREIEIDNGNGNGGCNNTDGQENENDNSTDQGTHICLQRGIVCPSVDGGHSVYGALPDCTQFCQCSNGLPYLHHCANGTHFNPVLNVCDYPDKAGCGGGNEIENGGGDGEIEIENGNGNGGCNNTDGQENENDNSTNPGTQICLQSGIVCPPVDGEHSVYGALPDCTQFCQCSNGLPYLHHCAYGTHFNPVLNVCDHPDKAGCAGENEIDNGSGNGEIVIDNGNGNCGCNTTDGQENENDNSTDPGTQICLQSGIVCPSVDGEHSVYGALPDCTQFCQCSNGFNVCDHPEKAGCAGGNEIENGGGDREIEIDNGNGNGGCNNTDIQENENDNSTDPGTQICLQSGIVCPPVDGEHSVYGALPDCTQFCQCSNGIPYLHYCAHTTHFNPVLNVCDHPDKAGCVGGTVIDNDGGEIEIENGSGNGGCNNTDGQENENDNSSNPGTQICLQSGIVCPPVDGEHSVYGALPDCTQFCQCSNGIPYLHYCAHTTHFNPVLNVCDHPDKAGCVGGSVIDNGGGEIDIDNGSGNGGCNNTDGQENENDNSTNPGTQICLQSGIVCPPVDGEHSVYGALPDCTQFCQCSNGIPYLHYCAHTTHFNPVLNVCDHPDKAGCVGGTVIDNGGGEIDIDNGNGNGGCNNTDGQENEKDNSTNPGTQICLQSGIVCPPVDGEHSVYGALPDCTQFCQCSNGIPYLHYCDHTTHFNPVLNVCDHPSNAGCIGGIGNNNESDNSNVAASPLVSIANIPTGNFLFMAALSCSIFVRSFIST
ncbi:hypothetical protein JTB14_036635 [Gonioctena quinquepunctata]|nr:hypothetical protein JTB14_036635 [Gonioctena quinquepunctata]